MRSTPDPIGRRDELLAVRRFLDAAEAGPQTMVLEGDAGVGKTTIWRSGIAAASDRGMTVLGCRCVESELGLPFTALADVLAELSPDHFDDLPSPQRRALDVALLRTDPGGSRLDPRALGTALKGLLRRASERSPVLVAVDDPPWMDSSSARAVDFAVRRLGTAPVSLLLARRTPADRGGLDVAAGHGGVERLRVGPLPLTDLAVLLRGRARHRVGRPEAERIHAESGGNPYFALEIARVRTEPDASVASAPPAGRTPLPDTLKALVAQRVETQPAAVRRVLLLVAAASRPSRSLLDSVPDEATTAGLETALDQQLLVGTGEALSFAHPLLASAAYWDATAPQRRLAHRQLSDVVPEQEERARHAALAATGPDAAVAAHLEAAASAASARGAPEHAAELLETALLLTPPGDVGDCERRTHHAADARFHAGDGAGAQALLSQLVTSLPTGHERASALAGVARICYRDGSIASTVEALEAALPQATGAPALQTAIERDLAWARLPTDVRSAEAHVQAALRLLPASADAGLTASVWTVRAVVGFLSGGGADLDLLVRADELNPQPSALVPWSPLGCRAYLLKWMDRFDESRHCYRILRERLAGHGDDGSLPFVCFHEAELDCWAGRWREAAQTSRLGAELAELGGQRIPRALCVYVDGLAAACRGSVGPARSTLAEALELGHGDLAVESRAHAALGFLELSVGDAAAACAHLAPFASMERLTGLREPGPIRLGPDLVESLLLLGDVDAAAPLADDLERQGAELDRPYALAAGARCVAMVAASDGRWDAALQAFDRSLVAHRRLPQPFELARTQLAHGVVLRRARRRAASRASLEGALAGFDRLGARLWSERARGELVRVGGGLAGDRLTPTENRVADLVAGGRTNREVAASLSLSVKTVEVNLTRIYRKLGVRSRTELARVRGRTT